MVSKSKNLKNVPFRGADRSPEARPGVPRESAPHPIGAAHWAYPEQQPLDRAVQIRLGIVCPTPVFSTALPPRGPSGALRRLAYRIPDHRIPHWILLLLADRIDMIQNLRFR